MPEPRSPEALTTAKPTPSKGGDARPGGRIGAKSTVLRNFGIDCEICDLSGLSGKKQWLNKIKSLPVADIYAFSTYSVTYFRTLEIRDLIKLRVNPDAITVAGGPHASALPVESAKDFDIIITGEAEQTFLEIVADIQRDEKKKGIFNGVPVPDLDRLPYPDFDLVNIREYHRIVEGKPSLSILSTRGCPFKCPYCNSRISNRGKFRVRSSWNVAGEIV